MAAVQNLSMRAKSVHVDMMKMTETMKMYHTRNTNFVIPITFQEINAVSPDKKSVDAKCMILLEKERKVFQIDTGAMGQYAPGK